MNTYGCFYGGKNIEVYAETSYAAQKEAQTQFQKVFPRRKIKGYDITVVLEAKDGEQIAHKPMM